MTPSGGLPFTVNGVLPVLDSPVMLVNLTGWIDASGAGAAAAEHIAQETEATEIITFDGDTFIDFRARRPVMEIREGVNSAIRWGVPTIRYGQDEKGKDLVLLTGPEPDSAWNFFCRTVADIAQELGVSRMIGLSAYPYGMPHTRAVGLSHTTPDKEISARLPHARNTVDVPAGVTAILEHELHGRGIPAITFWAQVPHYVATMQYSAASAALIDAASQEAGLTIDTSSLLSEAQAQRERLDELVSANPEHRDMVSKLEQAYDATHLTTELDIATNLPSAEQLAAEVEQFLRDQQTGGHNEG